MASTRTTTLNTTRTTKTPLSIDAVLVAAYTACVLFFSYTEGLSNITKVAGIVIGLRYAYCCIFQDQTFKVPIEFAIFSAWVLFALIGVFVSDHPNVVMKKIITVAQILAVSMCLAGLMIRMQTVNIVWITVLICTSAISVMVYQDPDAYTVMGRVVGTLGNANLYGLVCYIAVATSMYHVISSKKLAAKLVFLLPVPFLYTMLLESGSRKAMAVVTIVVAASSYIELRSSLARGKIQGAITLVLVLIALGYGLQALFNSKHFSRIENLIVAAENNDLSQTDGSFQGRIALYERAVTIAMENPATGIGLSAFSEVRRNEYSFGTFNTYTHSNIAEILVGTGILGFLIYFSMYASITLKIFKLLQNIRDDHERNFLLFTSMLFFGYVLYDFAMVSYYEKVSWLLLTTLITSVYLLERKAKSTIQRQRMKKRPFPHLAPD